MAFTRHTKAQLGKSESLQSSMDDDGQVFYRPALPTCFPRADNQETIAKCPDAIHRARLASSPTHRSDPSRKGPNVSPLRSHDISKLEIEVDALRDELRKLRTQQEEEERKLMLSTSEHSTQQASDGSGTESPALQLRKRHEQSCPDTARLAGFNSAHVKIDGSDFPPLKEAIETAEHSETFHISGENVLRTSYAHVAAKERLQHRMSNVHSSQTSQRSTEFRSDSPISVSDASCSSTWSKISYPQNSDSYESMHQAFLCAESTAQNSGDVAKLTSTRVEPQFNDSQPLHGSAYHGSTTKPLSRSTEAGLDTRLIVKDRLRRSKLPASWMGDQAAKNEAQENQTTPLQNNDSASPVRFALTGSDGSPSKAKRSSLDPPKHQLANYATPTKASQQRMSSPSKSVRKLRSARSVGTLDHCASSPSKSSLSASASVRANASLAKRRSNVHLNERFPDFSAGTSPDRLVVWQATPAEACLVGSSRIPRPRFAAVKRDHPDRQLETSDSALQNRQGILSGSKRAALLEPIARRLSAAMIESQQEPKIEPGVAGNKLNRDDAHSNMQAELVPKVQTEPTGEQCMPSRDGSASVDTGKAYAAVPPVGEHVDRDTTHQTPTLRGNAPIFSPLAHEIDPESSMTYRRDNDDNACRGGESTGPDIEAIVRGYVPEIQWFRLSSHERKEVLTRRRLRGSSSASCAAMSGAAMSDSSSSSGYPMDPQGNILSPSPAWHWSNRRRTASLTWASVPATSSEGASSSFQNALGQHQGWAIGSAQPGWWYGWRGGDGREIAFVGHGPDAEKEVNAAVNFRARGVNESSQVNQNHSSFVGCSPVKGAGSPAKRQLHAATTTTGKVPMWAQQLGYTLTPCGNMDIAQASEHIGGQKGTDFGLCNSCH